MEVGAVSRRPSMRGNRYFFSQARGHAEPAGHLLARGLRGRRRVLIDPAAIDPIGSDDRRVDLAVARRQARSRTARTAPATRTRRCTCSTSTRGRSLPLEIPNKTQAPDWLPDGSGFVYQNLEEPEGSVQRPGHVPPHGHGSARRTSLLFRQFTKAENEKLATTWGPFGIAVARRPLAGARLLGRHASRTTCGWWTSTRSCAPARSTRTVVTVGDDGQAFGTVIDDTLFCRRRRARRRAASSRRRPRSPAQAHWRDLVPERQDAVIESVVVRQGRHRGDVSQERVQRRGGVRL